MSRSKRLESGFQDGLIKDLKTMFFKMEQRQGIPDLLLLHQGRWAALECKQHAKAKHQPNQDYYVDKMNEMSFARFVYPENKQEVLDELYQTFQSRG